MDKNRKVVLKVLKAFCDDRRKTVTDELIFLWQVALENFTDQVIMYAFKSIVQNRSNGIGFDITHDQFVETCKSIRKNQVTHKEFNTNKLEFQAPKQLEDLSKESKKKEQEITSTEGIKRILQMISKDKSPNEVFQPSLSISEEVDIRGNVTGYVCHGHTNDILFKQECLNQFGVEIKTVKRTVAKTMAIADGHKTWLVSKITVGYLK